MDKKKKTTNLQFTNTNTLNCRTYGRNQNRTNDSEWFKAIGVTAKTRATIFDSDKSIDSENCQPQITLEQVQSSGEQKRICGLFSNSDDYDDNNLMPKKVTSKYPTKSKPKLAKKKKPLKRTVFSCSDSDESIPIPKKSPSKFATNSKPKLRKKRKSNEKCDLNSNYNEEMRDNNKMISEKRINLANKTRLSQPKNGIVSDSDDFQIQKNVTSKFATKSKPKMAKKKKSPEKTVFSCSDSDESIPIPQTYINSRRRKIKKRCSFKIKQGGAITHFDDMALLGNDSALFDTSRFFDPSDGTSSFLRNETVVTSLYKSHLRLAPDARFPRFTGIQEHFNETALSLNCSTVAKQSTPFNISSRAGMSKRTPFANQFQPFPAVFQLIPKVGDFTTSEFKDSPSSPNLPPRRNTSMAQNPLLRVQSSSPVVVLNDIRDQSLYKNLFKPNTQKLQEIRTSSFFEKTSALKSSLLEKSVSCREHVLSACRQTEPRPFAEIISDETECKKLGEGVFGEVFECVMENGIQAALKVLPIEGDLLVNGEKQKTLSEILPEILISGQLSLLAYGHQNLTHGFIELYRAHCVYGVYPQSLISEWDYFNRLKTSENDHPGAFKADQLYILLEYLIGGVDMEHFSFQTAAEAVSVIRQAIAALAVAEEQLNFEHRDLHWGNILIQKTNDDPVIEFILHGERYSIETCGVTSHIIDFTLSRVTKDGCSMFQDLSCDPDLFKGDASQDYQFEIYRMMRNEVENDWSSYKPKTNVFWISYLLEKCINHIRYGFKRRKNHIEAMKKLKKLKKNVLKYSSCYDLFTNGQFFFI